MTKVLWLVNPLQFADNDIDFPEYIQQLSGCNLHCVFLEDHVFDTLPMFTGDPLFPAVDFGLMDSKVNVENERAAEKARKYFADVCAARNLNYTIHTDTGDPVSEMVSESRFADMILVKSSLSFNVIIDETPSHFVKKVLSKAECPVLIMPDDHQTFDEIYFTYNGGYSSVYSIRQFTYLFPELKDKPVTVLFIDENENVSPVPHEKEIKELLNAHYSNVSFKIIRGDVESELLSEFLPKKNIIVTYGAFGRNNISRLFKRGSSDKVIEIIDVPLFITHP